MWGRVSRHGCLSCNSMTTVTAPAASQLHAALSALGSVTAASSHLFWAGVGQKP